MIYTFRYLHLGSVHKMWLALHSNRKSWIMHKVEIPVTAGSLGNHL